MSAAEFGLVWIEVVSQSEQPLTDVIVIEEYNGSSKVVGCIPWLSRSEMIPVPKRLGATYRASAIGGQATCKFL